MESLLVMANRDEGYINIDKILGLLSITSIEELVENLKNNKDVEIIQYVNETARSIQLDFSFKYNGEKYFYKYDCPPKPYKVSPYNELIAGEIAEDLGIPHVKYDLASVGGFKGAISKNFRQDILEYISGDVFLSKNHPAGNQEYISRLNNLEDIWIALEEHYGRKPEYQDIVSNVMGKVVDMFIFDILTGQTDRGYSNWWFIKYPNGVLDLQPLFDNMRILVLHNRQAPERFPCVSKPLLRVDSYVGRYLEDNLIKLLRISDGEFAKKLHDSLWVISPENLQKVFARIEEKTGHPMPLELKQFYLKEFAAQLDFLIETYDRIVSSKR